MADADKKILITPSTGLTTYPTIDFDGKDAQDVRCTAYCVGLCSRTEI